MSCDVRGLRIWRSFGAARIVLPLLGGIACSDGAILLTLGRPTPIPGVVGAHEVWHLFVLAGFALHWAFLFRRAGVDAHAKSPAHAGLFVPASRASSA